MKRFISASLLLIALVIFVTPAFAMELWDPHLRGVNEGLAAGLVPPKGFYFINNAYFAPNWHVYDNSADKTNTKLDVFVDVPIFLWSPGIKLLGADYAVAIAQPFDYTNLRVFDSQGNNIGGSQGGLYNTVLVPGILSWALPCNFHVAASFAIYLNDGTSSPGNPPSSNKGVAYAESANGFYTFEPGIGITWLACGWNLSADLHISVPLKNHDTDYLSAPEFWADYTAAKTIGKWTLGVGAYQQNQFGNDSLNGNTLHGTAVSTFGIGPLLGYNFGPVDVMATYNFGVYAKNDVQGDFFNLRMVIPFNL